MADSSISDITTASDRYKIYVLPCTPENLSERIDFVKTHHVPVINIGKELASFIDTLADYSYLNIDVYDFTKKLLESSKSTITSTGNDVVAIYNLGILLEPSLELNAAYMLREFSKSSALIIIWENESENPDKLNWPSQKNKFSLDFSQMQIKKLQYAI